MNFKKLAVLSSIIFFSVPIAACSSNNIGEPSVSESASATTDNSSTAQSAAVTDTAQTNKKEIVVGNAGGYFGSTDLNPAEGWNGWFLAFDGVGETLYKLDENYNAVPCLATEYKNIDDNTWEFTIRDNVKFHNGELLTAEEVKKSLEYMMSYTPRGPETYDFNEITADGQKLTITTYKPQPTLVDDLCDPLSVIQYISDGIDYATESIMTGPFIVTDFIPNEEIDVEKFEDYWGGAAKIDSARLLTYSDFDACNMALQTGEIDMCIMPPASALELFTDTGKYTTDMAVSNRAEMLTFNLKGISGTDYAIRKAVAMCIDRNGFAEMNNNVFVPEYGLFPDTVRYGGTDKINIDVDKCDVEGAKKVLEEAGYVDTDGDGYVEKDGQNIVLNLVLSTGMVSNTQFAQALQSQAKQAGLDIEINEVTDTTDFIANGDFDLTVSAATTANPQIFYNTYIKTGSALNLAGYSNPDADKLIDELQTTIDPDKRDELVIKVEQDIVNDLPFITFAHRKFYCVYKNSIKGYTAQPSEYYFLDNKMSVSE